MNENPEELLNLQPDNAADTGGPGNWWLAAIILPVLCAGLGVLSLFALPRVESDWFGARYILALLISFSLGALLSVACAGVSLVRRERNGPWSLLAALPCLFALISLAMQFMPASQQPARPAGVSRGSVYSHLVLLEKDPELGLRERWHESHDDLKRRAFLASAENGSVPYTAAQIERVYAVAPETKETLFQHPACTPVFLRTHFDEAWKLSAGGKPRMLDYMVWNPNLPLELLERVVQSTEVHANSRQSARDALAKRMRPLPPAVTPN